jgi:PPM family protein phosphatase
MTIALRYTVRSDVGLLREGNEDSAYAGPHLLAIADGMGGHAAGEVASAVAIKTLAPLDKQFDGPEMLRVLGEAITEANLTLRQMSMSDPSTEGMGTTVTALLWSGDEAALCHIGDSRAYLLRDGALQQISHDHTLVQSLVDEGRLTPEAAQSHPQRSLVVRALQSSIPAEPDLAMLKAQVGDRFLLCSDGLTDVVSDETLRTTLEQLTDLDAAVEQLVDLAIRSGGPDNITCILADVIDTDAGESPSEEVTIVGALAPESGEDCEPTRSDNPAARAHLLAQNSQQGDAESEPPRPSSSTVVDTAQVSEGSGSSPPVTSASQADPTEAGDDDVAIDGRRRRWPVVTSVLALLIGVVGAAGYYGYRLTQNQYYVGTAGGRVVVFRGLSQAVAGLSLSSVVQRTNIPLSALPSSEVASIKSTIGPEQNLRQARRIISQFRHDYRCAVVAAHIVKWVAHRPAPAPARTHAASGHAKTSGTHLTSGRPAAHQQVGTAKSALSAPKPADHNTSKPTAHGTTSKTRLVKKVKYPPEPVMPRFCPAFSGALG